MAIRIEKIAARDLGPLKEFKNPLGALNLIYLKNEGGKSLFTEFIIRSLFKSSKAWGRLREAGQGKVYVSGIDPQKSIPFSPTSPLKLEDYFEHNGMGLPTSLGRLLVVKEGEVELAQGDEVITKDIVKDLLSSKRILDQIDEKISKTIKNASLDESGINIPMRKEGKEYAQLKNDLKKLDELIEKVAGSYEKGELKELEMREDELRKERERILQAKRFKAYKLYKEVEKTEEELKKIPENELYKLEELLKNYSHTLKELESISKEIKKLEKEIKEIPFLEEEKDKLLKAKKHLAYRIWSEIKGKEKELKSIPEGKLSELKGDIKEYRKKIIKKDGDERELEDLGQKTKHYSWLSTAKENYSRLISATRVSEKNILYPSIFSLVMLITSIILILAGLKVVGAIVLLTSAAGIFYSILSLKKFLSGRWQFEEIELIKREFKERFNEDLKSLTQLESLHQELGKIVGKGEVLQENLKELEREIKELKSSIDNDFETLTGEKVPEEKWEEKLSELESKRRDLNDEVGKLKERLAQLDLDESEYEKENPGIKYDKEKLEEIRSSLEKLSALKAQWEGKKEEHEAKKERLKGLCSEIRKSFQRLGYKGLSENEWEVSFKDLKRKKDKLHQNLKKIQGELEGLGVPEKDYVKEDPGIEFSPSDLEKSEKQIERVREEREQEEKKLSQIKGEICNATNKDWSTSWSELLECLFRKKEEVEKELKEIEAYILGGILTHETLEELRSEEEEKLIEGINSEEVQTLMYNLTRKYKEIILENNDFIVAGDYDSYSINDLSTGAKEQVMLALRIGLAKRILKENSAFLIFDDAFQHSDYDKRPILVDTLVELAALGWQIVYLTMDDHIRYLFKERAKKLSSGFQEITYEPA